MFRQPFPSWIDDVDVDQSDLTLKLCWKRIVIHFVMFKKVWSVKAVQYHDVAMLIHSSPPGSH